MVQHELTGLVIVGVQLLLYSVTPWIVTDLIFYSSLLRCGGLCCCYNVLPMVTVPLHNVTSILLIVVMSAHVGTSLLPFVTAPVHNAGGC